PCLSSGRCPVVGPRAWGRRARPRTGRPSRSPVPAPPRCIQHSPAWRTRRRMHPALPRTGHPPARSPARRGPATNGCAWHRARGRRVVARGGGGVASGGVEEGSHLGDGKVAPRRGDGVAGGGPVVAVPARGRRLAPGGGVGRGVDVGAAGWLPWPRAPAADT